LKRFLEEAAKKLEETFNNSCAFHMINKVLIERVSEMTAEIERLRGNAQLLCTSEQRPTTLRRRPVVTKRM